MLMCDIISHGVPMKSFKKPKPIIVNFKSRDLKEIWLSKFKKKKILLNQLDSTFPPIQAFVSEHFTEYNKKLFTRLDCIRENIILAWLDQKWKNLLEQGHIESLV